MAGTPPPRLGSPPPTRAAGGGTPETAGGAPLAPYRVLDLTDETGWWCGRILADLGADVVKVEPPGGDPARRRDEGSPDGTWRPDSPDWLAGNASKRGITLALETGKGRDLLRRLAQRAAFLLESFPPGYLDARDVGYPALRQINSRLVLTSITPFGQTGPYAGYRGSDLIAMGMSGLMALVGEPGHPPLRVSVPQARMWAGMHAAAGTLIAHHRREAAGHGQHVDVSTQASVLWALANAPAHWSLLRQDLHRGGSRIVGRSTTGASMRAIYRCRDGYINFIFYGGDAGRRSNAAMAEWMAEMGEVPDWLKHKDWAAFNVTTATQEEIDELEQPFVDFLSGRTKAEFSTESLKRGILGYPVADVRDIRTDPQLTERGFWQPMEHSELDATVSYPGPFAKFSATTLASPRRAPQIGEHNGEIYGAELGLSSEELQTLRREQII